MQREMTNSRITVHRKRGSSWVFSWDDGRWILKRFPEARQPAAGECVGMPLSEGIEKFRQGRV